MSSRLLGAVLAGGKSRRYGQPKHGVAVGGVPMVARAVEVLGPVTDQVVVVSSAAVEGAGHTPVIPDRVSDRGPLGGLHAALHHALGAGLDGVFLLACDLPLVDPDVVSRLVDTAGRMLQVADCHAVAPSRVGGGMEPLCAVYSTKLLSAVEDRLRSDDLSLHALFREGSGQVVELGSDAFLNVNTPQDRERAEARLAEREGS